MNVNAIVSVVPYLRRYARALTGSQTRGDNYVRLCLETILAEPERMGTNDPKLNLFKAFHDGWRAVRGQETTDPDGTVGLAVGHHAARGLAALPPLERQVLLLVCLEEFDLEEAAEIVGLPVDEARTLLEKARGDVQLVASVPVLIIEDEPLIAMELARIVRELGHRVCGTAARQSEAVEIAARTRPALVLADIQLKGHDSGITAVDEILKRFDVPIIFVTGYPERLLTGESVEPAFVIPKPFSPEMLKTAIGQALSVVAHDSMVV